MAWPQTHLSTVDELKRDLPAVVDASIDEALLQANIEDAQDEVYDDLSKYVDWEKIEDLDEIPRVLNRLCRYRAAYLTIIRQWRNDDSALLNDELGNSILKHFGDRYDALLDKIATGAIVILDSSHDSLEMDEVRELGPGRIV